MDTLIPVVDRNGKFYRVPHRELDLLIEQERVLGFKRRDGWVILGEDPVRDTHSSHSFHGPERRRSA